MPIMLRPRASEGSLLTTPERRGLAVPNCDAACGVGVSQQSGWRARQPCDPPYACLAGGRDMIRNSRRVARRAWLPIALLVAVGCKQGPSPEVQARIDSLSQASSERDRLIGEVAENTRLVSEISRELAKVNVPGKALKISGESPLRASRDTLIQKIHYMTTREKKGVIQEEGGARFLFVLWKSGKTLVPSRNLDPSVFTSVDRRHLQALPLTADKEYHIVSRQDVSALETPPDHDGKLVGGAVKIADSARFWANSKYLIIIEG